LGAAAVTYMTDHLPTPDSSVPLWTTVITAVGLVFGLALLGYRVMITIGHKITKLTSSRAFVSQLTTSLITLTGSLLGLPLSSTHIVVGAVYGISIVDGIRNFQWKLILGIIASWVVTIPAAATLSILFFFVSRFALSLIYS
jgi:PiT family inorganic phosphate transporter